MVIKIGDIVYDNKDVPMMIILTKKDKENIRSMHPAAFKYCQFEEEKFTEDEIRAWMKEI